MSVNSQNTTKDKGIEAALKSAREILDNIYTFLKNTPNVNLLEEKITKANELFDSLVQFINSENKTKTLIFEKVLEVNNKFKEIENSTNMIKNSETLLSINSDTVMVKAKTDMNNTYEVSMDLTIHKLKEQENQSLKLKLNQDEENITITEIDYNTWSGKQSDNTISSNSQGGETTENPQNNPMSATPEDSATERDSDMPRTNTSVITKKLYLL
ncbi:hypothetical protein [Mycoplasmopsis felis]|uniref:hypothetical protein n=1 Tax=Mycoplasmopsis felis TaxID=33923 RepID=UPI002B002752|nr:hypothetical protein [Mycoplasmopsis felis]WQQ07879.1 hypothetical protein RRG57_00740 [Mycoplasmopsis felis]